MCREGLSRRKVLCIRSRRRGATLTVVLVTAVQVPVPPERLVLSRHRQRRRRHDVDFIPYPTDAVKRDFIVAVFVSSDGPVTCIRPHCARS
jgi:hypothetical protein